MSLRTVEMVSKGHPDKVADQISDAVLDYVLARDEHSRVAIETMLKNDKVIIAGELTTNAKFNKRIATDIVLSVFNTVKYEYKPKIELIVSKQSNDIALGVDQEGAGDQGMVFGYATAETKNYMPLVYNMATQLMIYVDKLNSYDEIKGDGKCQVTVNDSNQIVQIVVSKQTTDEKLLKSLVMDIFDNKKIDFGTGNNVTFRSLFTKDVKIYINPTGKFNIGGPFGDTGLTGRKIIVDTYGGIAHHGGGAFCVDGDTEYLTPDGWKKINSYKTDDLVAQWDDYNINFCKPYNYYAVPAEKMYSFNSPYNIDMALSQHHNIVLETSKGNIVKKMVKDFINPKTNNLKNGNNGFIPTSFKFTPNTKSPLTDDQIRLQIAFCADGTMGSSLSSRRVHLKKQYKKDRLRELLTKTNTEFKETEYDTGADKEYTSFYFNPPIESKSLKQCFSDMSFEQMGVFTDELFKWDGNRENVFRTTIKEDADFAQFVLMAYTGKSVSITIDDRIGEEYGTRLSSDGTRYIRKSILYQVSVLDYSKTTFRYSERPKHKISVQEFTPADNKMYCFTVPTGMLLLRRNNHVFVTGNCGKDLTKVDRSGAYYARQLAEDVIKAGLAKEVEIRMSFVIGVKEIADITTTYCDNGEYSKIDKFVKEKTKGMTVKDMISRINPIISFENLARYGHFTNR